MELNRGVLQAPFRRLIIEERNINTHTAGLMDQECMHCSALRFREDSTNDHFTTCCHNRLTHLPQPHTTHEQELKHLFEGSPQTI